MHQRPIKVHPSSMILPAANPGSALEFLLPDGRCQFWFKTPSTNRSPAPTLSRMNSDSHGQNQSHPHRIELKLREMSQLFNTMDPSPFHEKDLDRDAEEFIVSWAREFPLDEPVALVVHLGALPQDQEPQPMIEQAVHHYFAYRVELNRREFRHLMQDGRRSLLTGLVFLAVCLTLSRFLVGSGAGTLSTFARESLAIAGWVAMWRPMEIYLYDWWPLRRRERILRKLSQMAVEVRKSK
jgi:hypothetical protein